jgi:8-oxo-dGTP pyrophosphatase MutT (NUDIX family)
VQTTLEKYKNLYPDEANLAEDFLMFLNAKNEDSFCRTNLTRHFTASVWLISPDGNEALLTHHRKLNRWLQLGGHCDGNSDVLASALREAREESGIEDIQPIGNEIFDLDKHFIPSRTTEPEHFHYDIRFLVRAATKEFLVSDESNHLKWFHHSDHFFQSPEAQDLRRMHARWKKFLAGEQSC